MSKKRKRRGRSLNERYGALKDKHRVIVDEARAWVRANWCGPVEATCLHHAAAAIIVAKRHGIRLVLQAGSGSWARMPPELDDGVSATHFSYMWEGLDHPAVQAALSADVLPEMHCWAGDPKRQHIVDLTAGYQPRRCTEVTGLPWLAPELPDFVWGSPPQGAVYEAHEDATRLAASLFQREIDNRR